MCVAFEQVHDGYLSVDTASLYYRDIGQGQPVIVLHGGPDFDLFSALERLETSGFVIHGGRDFIPVSNAA